MRLSGGGRLPDVSDLIVKAGASVTWETPDAIWSLNGAGNIHLDDSQPTSSFLVVGNTGNAGGLGSYSGQLSGTGSFAKRGSGTFTMSGDNTYSGGTAVQQGTLLVNNSTGSGTGSGPVDVSSGATLGGHGSIDGLLTIEAGGTLAPGTSVGQFGVQDVVFDPGAIFEVEIGELTAGSEFDQLVASGMVTLDGVLDVAMLDLGGSYVPSAGDRFEIISSPNHDITGIFSSETFPEMEGSTLLDWLPVDYSDPRSVFIEIAAVSVCVEGDVDCDGDVDFQDYLALQTGFGTTSGAQRSEGDLDGDGDVDFEDFLILQIHFGSGLDSLGGGGTGPATQTVPEPHALMLAVIGLLASLIRRDRRTRR